MLKTKKKLVKPSTNSLLDAFIGEEVIIVHPSMQTISDDQGGFALCPVITDGILMEIDHNMKFVGVGNGMEVESVIHFSQITSLTIKKEPLPTNSLFLMNPEGGQC